MKAAGFTPMGNGKGLALPGSFSTMKVLIDIGFLKILLVLLSPFRSFLAWQLFCGRSIWQLVSFVQRSLLTTIGWLAAPSKSRALPHFLTSVVDVRRWHLAAAALVLYSAVSSALRAWRDSKDTLVQQRRALERKLASSKSFYEWSVNAAKLDGLSGNEDEVRWQSETKLYDRRLLEEKVSHLRAVRTADASVVERMFAVRADLLRNLGNMASAALHEHFPIVPGAIREYIDEVRAQLEDITHSPDLPLAEKAAFLKETRHAFGRTALVLSGGGALGTFHLGVVKTLAEHKLLPRVLAGSSVGAVVAALAATRTDTELASLLDDVSTLDLAFFSHAAAVPAGTAGSIFLTAPKRDTDAFMKRLRHLLGDLTFLEAYTRTGRVLNLSVAAAGAAEPPRLLNYLTAPHVVVWSAVACSSAFPGLPQPRELLARSAGGELVKFSQNEGAGATPGTKAGSGWHDGSLEDDIPMRGLSEMFGVNHFIVSQTTPHIVPFLNLKRALGVAGQLAEAEIKHRCRQALEVLPLWRWPARWLRAFSQPWEGDITICLPDAANQLAKTVIGPRRGDLLQAVRQGETCTWAKLSAIQCNCGIESTLDSCIQLVAGWERATKKERKAAVASGLPMDAGGLLPWTDYEALFEHKSQGKTLGNYQYSSKQQGGIFPNRKKIGVFSSTESLLSMSLSHAVGAEGTPGGTAYATVEKGGTVEKGYQQQQSDTTTSTITGTGTAAPPSSPTLHGYVPDAAYECTDSSVNAFGEWSPRPASARSGRVLSPDPADVGSTRNSLDWIAP